MSTDSQTNTDKINLVYIASIGRSGSTLLESMLGAHSRVQTMGELHIWPHEIEGGGIRPCSCGEFVEACKFWSYVSIHIGIRLREIFELKTLIAL